MPFRFGLGCNLDSGGGGGTLELDIARVRGACSWYPTKSLRVCVCVCVCVFSSHPFWTSRSLDLPAGATQEEGHTGFFIHLLSAVRALIFLARRIQPFLSLVDREVEFCVLTIQSFSTRWAFLFLFFSFLVKKIPFAGVELTSQRVRGLRGTSELPGRPAFAHTINLLVRAAGMFFLLFHDGLDIYM